MNNKKTGALIAERRRELGLTQQQLADLLGVTNKAVSKWERGDGYPDIALISPLADVLNLSADELLKGERRLPEESAEDTLPKEPALSEPRPAESDSAELFTREFLPVEKPGEDSGDSPEPAPQKVFGGLFLRDDDGLRPSKWVWIASGILAVILLSVISLLLLNPSLVRPEQDSPVVSPSTGTASASSAATEPPETTTAAPQTTAASTTAATTTTTATTATTKTTVTRPPLPGGAPGDSLTAPEVLLYDLTAGKTLYGYHSAERRDPASLVKLMTAIVAIEAVDADSAHYVVGSEQSMVKRPESSLAYLQEGWDMPVTALLHAMLLPSGCDAAYTLAAGVGREVGGASLSDREAVDVFVGLMNETAARLGASSTHFTDPDGFGGGNLSTADDLVLIARYAMQKPLIRNTAAKVTLRDTFYHADGVTKEDITWDSNTNLMISSGSEYYYPGANGLKTGSSDSAGFCLIVTAQRDGRELMAVVLGAPRNNARWEDARALLDAGFGS